MGIESTYDVSKKLQLDIITRLVAKAATDFSAADRFAYQDCFDGRAGERFPTKRGSTAARSGCHFGIHSPIFTKIGGLREDMGPDQNPEYLLIPITDGLNIGYIQIR